MPLDKPGRDIEGILGQVVLVVIAAVVKVTSNTGSTENVFMVLLMVSVSCWQSMKTCVFAKA
jgi:hypothetical protein